MSFDDSMYENINSPEDSTLTGEAEENDTLNQEVLSEESTLVQSSVSSDLGERSVEGSVTESVEHLSVEMIPNNIFKVAQTDRGYKYGFTEFISRDGNLVNIEALTAFLYIVKVDLSGNKLTAEALRCLEEMPRLLSLNVSRNRIASTALGEFRNLEYLDLSDNKIKSVENMRHPNLETLILHRNEIDAIEIKYSDMPELRVLDLSSNLLLCLPGNFCPTSLTVLYLGDNVIATLERASLATMPNLRVLHLRRNCMAYLDMFEHMLPHLEYLNLRENCIPYMSYFKHLGGHKQLRTLIVTGNPFMTSRDVDELDGENNNNAVFRADMLAFVPSLQRLNKYVIGNAEKLTGILEGSVRYLQILNEETNFEFSDFDTYNTALEHRLEVLSSFNASG